MNLKNPKNTKKPTATLYPWGLLAVGMGLTASAVAAPSPATITAKPAINVVASPGHRQQAAPAQTHRPAPQSTTAPEPGQGYETPASLACVYNLVAGEPGCSPDTATAVPTGGSKAIAFAVPYHYPEALADLQAFSKQFGLAAPDLEVVYAAGNQPDVDESWGLFAAAQLQWAHAAAPQAKLYLVEAASNNFTDLLAAVDKATALVQADGGGQVVMAWGADEFAGQTALEGHFSGENVTYLAAAGNDPGQPHYPCTSPQVLCVGSTLLRRRAGTFEYINEVPFVYGGNGSSQYFPRPAYQEPLAAVVGSHRAVPDMALVADCRNSGAWVYWTSPFWGPLFGGDWYVLGGTTWSTSFLVGILNASGAFYRSSTATLENLYADTSPLLFRDIQTGWCGRYSGWDARPGWDKCTGLGSVGGLK